MTAEPTRPRPARAVDRKGERGSATAFVCLALTALIALTVLIAQIGATVAARHRAQSAADLAALAAAGLLIDGPDAGCAEAAALARRMSARVDRCQVEQWDAVVTVTATTSFGAFGKRVVSAAARAGPVDASG